jgi:hypothetical protein
MDLHGYHIIPDHSEPRQSVFHVMHEGKLVETFYSRAEAALFIAQTIADIIFQHLTEEH